MECSCGSNEFFGRQVCHVDVIVSGDNEFQRNAIEGEMAVYWSGNPFGPYTCNQCHKVYEDLP